MKARVDDGDDWIGYSRGAGRPESVAAVARPLSSSQAVSSLWVSPERNSEEQSSWGAQVRLPGLGPSQAKLNPMLQLAPKP